MNSFSELLPLVPLLLTTVTVVLAMVLIGIRRGYTTTAAVTILGLIAALISAVVMMGDYDQQVTPLLIVDEFSLFFTALTLLIAAFGAVLSFPYLFDLDDQREEYFLLLGLATLGAVVMVSSNHFVSAVLGLETLSMSLYGMVAYPLHSREVGKYPIEASIKYLVLSAASSAFILFGMALIYTHTGTLAFVSLSQSAGVTVAGGESLAVLGLMLIIAGVAFKLSLAPFHLWTPDVYEGAPIPATAYLATIGKGAMFVLLLRFVADSDALAQPALATVLGIIAILSIVAGNLLALLQENLKRILAYSSIAHMGYVLIALIATWQVEDSLGVEAIAFYLLAYMIMTLGAFGVASVISCSNKEYDVVTDYRGLFWRAPWLAVVFTTMLLSLAGIPLTVGFIAKFYVLFAGVEAGLWLLLFALVLGSGIGLYYYLRIVYQMLLPPASSQAVKEAGIESISSYIVLGILLFLVLLLGIYPAPAMELLESAAAAL